MTEYLNDDFEDALLSPWDAKHESNGTYTPNSTDYAHHGSQSGKAVVTDQTELTYALAREALNDPTERFFRVYLYLPTLTPDDEANILHLMLHQASTPTIWCILGIGMAKDGSTPKWRVRDGVNGIWEWIASPAPEAETWFCVEIYVKKHASEGALKIWINNNVEGSPDWEKTGLDTSGITLGQAYIGIIAGAWNVAHSAYHDCAIIADAFIGEEAGAVQKSVAGSVGGSGSVLVNKSLVVSGSVDGLGSLLRDKSLVVAGLTEGLGAVDVQTGVTQKQVQGLVDALGSVLRNKTVQVLGSADGQCYVVVDKGEVYVLRRVKVEDIYK